MKNIRIAIVDDHPIVLDGLKSVLALYPHFSVVGTYRSAEDFMTNLQQDLIDVLLLDIQLTGKQGDEILPLLVSKFPEMKILVLTNFKSAVYVNTVINNGANGYLLKTVDREVLIKGIESVYNGTTIVDEQLQQQYATFKQKSRPFKKVALSGREKEILQLIANGLTNPEIAKMVNLSIHTVENYRDSILLKLECKNSALLVKKAIQLGLILL